MGHPHTVRRGRRWGALLLLLALWGPLGLTQPRPAHAAAVAEQEPNNTLATAQALGAIGREQPVEAEINPDNDRDFFRFQAAAGRTYVVELYEVLSSLHTGGSNCDVFGGDGLALRAYNPANTRVAGSCQGQNRAGEVQVAIQFTAGVSGAYTIEVFSNDGGALGGYKLRVLPKYSEPGASWDAASFEPNNMAAIAYDLAVGREQAITSAIEGRESLYSTFFPDVDWYRFPAAAGRTYVVEIFNAANTLTTGGQACDIFGGDGLALFAYSPALGSPVAGTCRAPDNSQGNVHTALTLTAGVSGDYFLKIFPNNPGGAGSYQLRIVPKFGEPGASWDATTFEPNNQAANAYPLEIGREHPLQANIEGRDSAFSTFFPDVDWYRFAAQAGRTYVVELFDVTNTLGQGGNACTGWGSDGMSLFLYSPALGNAVAGTCSARDTGSANVHASAQITAGVSGTHYVKILPSSREATGSYRVRVLPKYDEGGSWDTAHEPNNRAATAFNLAIGPEHAATTTIEGRNAQLATYRMDEDWFVFNGSAGRRYTVELFNVAPNLDSSGGTCTGWGAKGMALFLFDPSVSEPIAGQCGAQGGDGAHTRASFTAGESGPYFVRAYPNNSNAAGGYTIRVCAGECPRGPKIYLPLLRR